MTSRSNSRLRAAPNPDPLSADAMDAFRCPTRIDFLNAASAGDPFDNLIPSSHSRSFTPRVATLKSRYPSTNSPSISRTRSKGRCVKPLRTSRLTDDEDHHKTNQQKLSQNHQQKQKDQQTDNAQYENDHGKNHKQNQKESVTFNLHIDDYEIQSHDTSEEEENCVPPELMDSLLDAMDHISADSELRAISQWLERLRTRAGCPVQLTDSDLSNGVALLDALTIAGAITEDDEISISRNPDVDGQVAKSNLTIVRLSLEKFPWRASPPMSMLEMDVWNLPRYVLLAALSCDSADALVTDMLECDEWVQRRLSETVAEGLRDMGLTNDEDSRARELEQQVEEERERADTAQAEIARLERAIDGWRVTCEALEDTVQTVTARLEQAQKEVKKFKEKEKEREKRRAKDREGSSHSNATGGAVVLKERNRSGAAAAKARSAQDSPSRPTISRKDSRTDDSRTRRRGDSNR